MQSKIVRLAEIRKSKNLSLKPSDYIKNEGTGIPARPKKRNVNDLSKTTSPNDSQAQPKDNDLDGKNHYPDGIKYRILLMHEFKWTPEQISKIQEIPLSVVKEVINYYGTSDKIRFSKHGQSGKSRT